LRKIVSGFSDITGDFPGISCKKVMIDKVRPAAREKSGRDFIAFFTALE